jgi:hypothetical protein
VILARRKGDQNLAVVDPWTFVHAGTGLALGLLAVPLWQAVAGAVAYEAIEAGAETRPGVRAFFKVSAPETFPNQAADLAVFTLGVWLGHRWNRTGG